MNENDNVVNTWVRNNWKTEIDPFTGKPFTYKSRQNKETWKVIGRLKKYANILEGWAVFNKQDDNLPF